MTDEQRFWIKVERRGPDECWFWTAALQRDGYAHFTNDDRKTISAHRRAYEILVGPIPDGMDLLHSCDVRHCVNPAHLRPGSHAENMAEAKARLRHAYGERSYNAKLTEEIVIELRRRAKAGANYSVLAREFGHPISAVTCAINGHSWGHITEEPPFKKKPWKYTERP